MPLDFSEISKNPAKTAAVGLGAFTAGVLLREGCSKIASAIKQWSNGQFSNGSRELLFAATYLTTAVSTAYVAYLCATDYFPILLSPPAVQAPTPLPSCVSTPPKTREMVWIKDRAFDLYDTCKELASKAWQFHGDKDVSIYFQDEKLGLKYYPRLSDLRDFEIPAVDSICDIAGKDKKSMANTFFNKDLDLSCVITMTRSTANAFKAKLPEVLGAVINPYNEYGLMSRMFSYIKGIPVGVSMQYKVSDFFY